MSEPMSRRELEIESTLNDFDNWRYVTVSPGADNEEYEACRIAEARLQAKFGVPAWTTVEMIYVVNKYFKAACSSSAPDR